MLNLGWLSWTTPKPERKWIVVCAVARILSRQPIINADDLHQELPLDQFPWDRRTFGAVLRGLESKGKLVALGYKPSIRPECHGRPILTYRENSSPPKEA